MQVQPSETPSADASDIQASGKRVPTSTAETGRASAPDTELEAHEAMLALARAGAHTRYAALRDLGKRRVRRDPAGASRAFLSAWQAATELSGREASRRWRAF